MSELDKRAEAYMRSVMKNDGDVFTRSDLYEYIIEAYKQGYIDRDTQDLEDEQYPLLPPYLCLGHIPLGDTTQGLRPIEYTYDPNRKPDWSVQMTPLELEKYCRVFGIKLSETPSMEDYERAAKELSERFQKMTKDLFDKQDV